MEKNYLMLIVKKFLNIKNTDSLFISLSIDDINMLDLLIDILKSLKIDDIYYEFYEDEPNKPIWGKYIEKNAKFLFIVNNNFNDTFASIIMNAFEKEEIDINYTSIPSYSILKESSCDINFLSDKRYIELFNESMKELSKKKTEIQNANLKRLILKSYGNAKLEVEFEGRINLPLKNKKITRYPYIPLEYIFKDKTCNGYVDASSFTYILGEKVEDLRIIIKEGYVIDFDCKRDKKTNWEKIENFFKKSKFPYVYALGVVNDDTSDLILTGTQLIDDVTRTYLLIKNDDGDSIYLPISHNRLYIDGLTSNGEYKELYNSDKLIKKLLK